VKYPITDIFYSLQGEGHFVGYPMVFVRLAGCSVQECHIRKECDEAPWKAREVLSEEEILSRVRDVVSAKRMRSPVVRTAGDQHAGGNNIVCITGGEPTDHDLTSLLSVLRDTGYRLHIETSGVRAITGIPFEWITVSPKTKDYVQRSGHTLKVVVRPEWDELQAWREVEEYDRGTEFFHRYLQPTTLLGRPVNTEVVTKMLLGGWNAGRWALSTQGHRYWNLP
jgi:7-carboxy-7-deazaguanine synthase